MDCARSVPRLQPRSQDLSSSHKREWSKSGLSSTTPSYGKTKDPGNEVATPFNSDVSVFFVNRQDNWT